MPNQLIKDLKDVDEGLKEAKQKGDTEKEEKLEKAQAHFGQELNDYKKDHNEEKKVSKTESDSQDVPHRTNDQEPEKDDEELNFLREYYKDNELRKKRSDLNKKFSVKDNYTELLHKAHKNDDDNSYLEKLKEYKKSNPEMFNDEAKSIVKFDQKEENNNKENILKGLY